ncbi:MAG TPA: queuosine precursor transporter [Mesorhizobium sp.]|jgi:hypothetical protein|nr:queuosine precursor transporter [Mesorhizobium sp.]
MDRFSSYAPFAVAMALAVLASNVLVQFPVQAELGGVALADLLTWGAFTYPLAFLVTDLANRRHGPAFARGVVMVGFALAVFSSIVFPPLLYKFGLVPFETEPGRLMRIALASGAAFLLGQLLDVSVFNRLRRQAWWRAPTVSSITGSVLDTAVFFSLAFAPAFLFLGPNDGFALEAAPLLGVFEVSVPRWVSWAFGDLGVKLALAVVALIPFRLIAARWSQPAAA